jgi:hypothetical protein
VSSSDAHKLGVSRAEHKWVLWFGLLVMVITTIPYIVGYARQGAGWQFTGFVFGIEDGNSYIAKMLSSAYGAWLFRTPYTTSFQQGVVAFIPYFALGKLVSGTGMHEQLVALYHIFRIGAGILAILATYEVITLTTNSIDLRRFGLILCVLGGGLGWLAVFLGSKSLPLEFYSPETFGFLSLFGIPHLALARATFLWSLVVYLRFALEGDSAWWQQSLRLGLLWLATALAQPITALVLGVVIGLHCLVTGFWQLIRQRDERVAGTRKWWSVVLMVAVSFLLPAPFLLYNYISFSSDPFLRAWTVQNIIRSPDPTQYLLAYGLILPFAISGAIQLLRSDAWKGLFFASWVLALPLLAYAPFNLQRRLLEGMWVALVALAMAALEAWRSKNQSNANSWMKKSDLRRWVLLLALPSTIILLFGGFLTSWQPAMPVFRLNDESRAFDYLRQVATPGDVVLASFDTSNALPAWAPLRVVIGHGPESVGLAELRPRVDAFYSPTPSDEERIRFLEEHGVRYVIWGPLERKLGQWDPGTASYLKKIQEVGEFQIYETVPALTS